MIAIRLLWSHGLEIQPIYSATPSEVLLLCLVLCESKSFYFVVSMNMLSSLFRDQ